jgi:ferrous iron transport protein A
VARTLVDLRPGESARVKEVSGDSNATRRLMDLGVVRGTSIQVVRVAPLGDPIEVTLRGFMLSLRRAEAANVVVE